MPNNRYCTFVDTLIETGREYLSLSKESLAEALWPTRCVLCDMPGHNLCPACTVALPYLDRWQACPRCGAAFGRLQCTECNPVTLKLLDREKLAFNAAASAVMFDEHSSRVVRSWKDCGARRLSFDMAKCMAHAAPPEWFKENLTVIPIPATTEALRRRGFDHGLELAQQLASFCGCPSQKLFLPPKTKDQRKLSRKGRVENLAQTFSLIANEAVPARVLLTDDVFTTGSTFSRAADSLRAAGCKEIYCLSFARV